jgi:hypothetical protein
MSKINKSAKFWLFYGIVFSLIYVIGVWTFFVNGELAQHPYYYSSDTVISLPAIAAVWLLALRKRFGPDWAWKLYAFSFVIYDISKEIFLVPLVKNHAFDFSQWVLALPIILPLYFGCLFFAFKNHAQGEIR